MYTYSNRFRYEYRLKKGYPPEVAYNDRDFYNKAAQRNGRITVRGVRLIEICYEFDLKINSVYVYMKRHPELTAEDVLVKHYGCDLTRLEKHMTPNEYQKLALRTMNKDIPEDDVILNAALGLCGEAGEFADSIKKMRYQGHTLDHEHLKKELGDICWYIALGAKALGTDLETIMQMNIDKLRARYPDGFTSEQSMERKANDD